MKLSDAYFVLVLILGASGATGSAVGAVMAGQRSLAITASMVAVFMFGGALHSLLLRVVLHLQSLRDAVREQNELLRKNKSRGV